MPLHHTLIGRVPARKEPQQTCDDEGDEERYQSQCEGGPELPHGPAGGRAPLLKPLCLVGFIPKACELLGDHATSQGATPAGATPSSKSTPDRPTWRG